jgi:CheY-like chemotaxis protein
VVVEDDLGHVVLIQRACARATFPYDLVFLQDSQEALEYFGPYASPQYPKPGQAYVVLDLDLPSCSGLEVLRSRKHHAAMQHIPVLIFTIAEDPHTIEHCYALGCNAYFTKPLQAEQ